MVTETKKQVMIVGPGPSRKECLYDCEVWTPDKGWNYAPRIDKVFCMGNCASPREMWEAKKKFGFSVVAAKPLNGFDVELYPIEEVVQYAPMATKSATSQPYKIGFFANDIAYMIAYSIIRGYESVKLYGVDILDSETFISEKGSMEYWLGVALGKGMKIWNARGSVVCRTHNGKIYGYWGDRQKAINELLATFQI